MSLITKHVYVNLCSANIKYYEDNGYYIPRYIDKKGRLKVKRGTKIEVDVKDLPHQSEVNVLIKCDNCNKEYTVKYASYVSMRKDEKGKTYCNKCANRIYNYGDNSYWKGRKQSEEHKRKLSKVRKGKNKGKDNPRWNPNLKDEDRINRRIDEKSREWTIKVKIKDNHVCQKCGKIGGKLESHHLNGFNWFKEGRYDINNGVTLCDICHKNFHHIYGKGYNTKEQYMEWSNNKIKYVDDVDIITAKRVYCVEEDKIYESAIKLAEEWGLKSNSQIYDACNRKIIKKKRIKKNGDIIYYEYIKEKVKGKTLKWID